MTAIEQQVLSDEDLSSEILSRLPVKSVIRCRCVCKAWCSLISHPLLVKKYTSRHTKSKSSFRLLLPTFPLRSVECEAPSVQVAFREHYYPVSMPKPKSSLEIYGSCHGLVCLAIDYHTIILWNPSTGESKLLPEPTPRAGRGKIDFYGFGYDSTTQDYKIVRGYDYEEFPEFKFEVFALKTGSWRQHPIVGPTFDVDTFMDVVGSLGQGFLTNEALHWIDSEHDVTAILVFSFAEEKFRRMLPNIHRRSNVHFEVGIVGDCLAVYLESSYEASLWVMKEYGVEESWTQLLNFYTSGCLRTKNCPPMLSHSLSYSLRPLCILENGELLLANTEGDYNHFTLYDPKGKTFRDLIEIDAGPSTPTIDAGTLVRPVIGPAIYEETFVSPVIGSM